MKATRIDWGRVLEAAAEIVWTYVTRVTLRQLHYRLVSMPELYYPNTQTAYKSLSARTAEARRRDEFPALWDRTRNIHQPEAWESPSDAVADMVRYYRLDRTRGQVHNVVIGVEKAGLLEQLKTWFHPLGLPIIALGGYSSQDFVDRVAEQADDDERDAVLLYAGDFDASGEDIDRDFVRRTDCWSKVVRVALSAEQVDAFALPAAIGKANDPRAGGFVARHGRLEQVELDAVAPDVLERLYRDALAEWWDESEYEATLAEERRHVVQLEELADLL